MNNNKQNKKNRNQDSGLEHLTMTRQVCPDSVTVPLSYYTVGEFSAAFTGYQLFALNSVFDPDVSGVGHQPLGYDQWKAFYNRYRVEKVEIEIDMINESTISNTMALVIANNENTTIDTQAELSSAIESPFANAKLIPMQGNNNIWRFKRSYDVAQILGVPRQRYISNIDYSAQVGASPTELVFLHVVMQDLVFSSNITGAFRLKLKYHTTFFDRNQLTQS